MEVRERIRINGKAISKAQFTAYFWEIYIKLESTKSEYNGSMPRPHTIFLNTMGLYVFLREKVENIAHNFTLTLQSCYIDITAAFHFILIHILDCAILYRSHDSHMTVT